MCRVSDKIKFCTCSVSLDQLKNYWVLHRYVEGKLDIVIGQPLMPYNVDEQTDTYNKEVLLKRVNEADAFDVNLNPKENDRLQVTFTRDVEDEENMNYGFVFKNGKWEEEGYDALEWMWRHEEETFGKVKEAFK
jgi:hypothetical protein